MGQHSAASTTARTAEVTINRKVIPFKLDTGAEVTAISEEALQMMGKPNLQRPSKQLCGPDKKPLDLLGSFTTDLSYKQQTSRQEVFVVRELKSNLLGLPAIMALQLLAKVESLHDEAAAIRSKFRQLFQGLGTMKGEYEIRLKPNATPHALFTCPSPSQRESPRGAQLHGDPGSHLQGRCPN